MQGYDRINTMILEKDPRSMPWTFRFKKHSHELARMNFATVNLVTEGHDVAGLPIIRRRQDQVGKPILPSRNN